MSFLSVAASVLLIATPAIGWFWLISRLDGNPEPRGLLLRIFGWGMLMLVPAALFERTLSAWPLLTMLLVGPVEELAKFVAASSAARDREFDEPIDGLIYAAVAALGFATLENVLYVAQGGLSVLLVRGPVTTFSHVLFAVPWGYALSVKRFRGRRGVLRKGLLVGATLHSVFNLMLTLEGSAGSAWLLIPFAGMLAVMYALAARYYARLRPDCRRPRTQRVPTTSLETPS
ncbi:MAG TPA: PrsW family intramembrane metalloprotease [Deinococcales bacterium]|nr:PrsW family intramembrane metalloprotease [Deinococcales bacterium]